MSLLEHGKMFIQIYDCPSNFVCCMNDYNEIDGSFRYSDFVCTMKQVQETGDYFYCTCKTFHTLINLKDCKNRDQDFFVLDSSGENFVTCLHCKFLKQKVAPVLEMKDTDDSRLQRFVQESLKFQGNEIVEIYRNKDTRKFSVVADNEEIPSLVHLTFNKNVDHYIVSCFNGKCLSSKGHKKTLKTFANAAVCKHLTILRNQTAYWHDLIEKELPPTLNGEENIILGDNLEKDSEPNFDENTGLWKFLCKSRHAPSERNSPIFKKKVIERDNWNDCTLERFSDGCLNGPVLVSDIPEFTCDCGSGWLSRTDEEDYCADGRTCHDKNRLLIVYTTIAPVKCQVHVRLCYNLSSPCTLSWDEGEKESIHVLSRDTAAGDEIGWEFVSMVLRSGCTFSGFCQLKNNNYQLRADNARFMDPAVFIKWWFSWVANMKIDFRRPCDICGFEPKRLCCDGTNVGIGLRNANFEEISTFEPNTQPLNTLHRRMDRCFLKNMDEIEKHQMIQNRETLDYLAKREIKRNGTEELDGFNFIDDAELNERIDKVKEVLPDEILLSFERFFHMNPSEKLAYAYVLKMLSTTASVTSVIPPAYCARVQQLIQDQINDVDVFNSIIFDMRTYAPELRDLITESMLSNNDIIQDDIKLLLQYLINQSLDMEVHEPEVAVPQPGTYNPAKFGRAYYFNESGLKLRNIRPFTIDLDGKVKKNLDHDDNALDFERCEKFYSKVEVSAKGSSNLFLWFCADHGHCYGFHMTRAEGRKDPSASLYAHLEKPPQYIFYDFACNLQEYCLNRESGYYKDVRFFHDIFHSYAHKCSCAFKSRRLQGIESVNPEICEQFNSFIQCIKTSARQMSQAHFCFYLQFFLYEWNERKRILSQKKIRVALAGVDP